MDADELGREGGVSGQEVLERVAVLEEDAVGIVLRGIWLRLGGG